MNVIKTAENQYPAWQAEIRKAQQARDEIRLAREQIEAEAKAAKLREKAAELSEKLKSFDIPVPDDLPEPKWVSPDGYEFRLSSNRQYHRSLVISVPVEYAAERVLDEYADWIDGGWLNGYQTEIQVSLEWNNLSGAKIADALDEVRAEAQLQPGKNEHTLERLRERIAEVERENDDDESPADAPNTISEEEAVGEALLALIEQRVIEILQRYELVTPEYVEYVESIESE